MSGPSHPRPEEQRIEFTAVHFLVLLQQANAKTSSSRSQRYTNVTPPSSRPPALRTGGGNRAEVDRHEDANAGVLEWPAFKQGDRDDANRSDDGTGDAGV